MLLLLFAACDGPAPKDTDPAGDTGGVADTDDTDTLDTDDTDTGPVDTDDTDPVDTDDTDTADPGDTAGEPLAGERVLLGTEEWDDAGRNVVAGDVDGDGRDDLLVTSHRASGALGGGFLVLGPVSASGDLDAVGTRITSEAAASGAGRSASLGDADGDGLLDVGLGAPFGSTQGLWVLGSPLGASPRLADAVAVLVGPSGAYCGHGSALGDVDGDGIADGVVGCYGADGDGEDAGGMYVAFGPLLGTIDLAAEADAVLVGEQAATYAGRFLVAGQDVDGDGIGDMLVGAPSASVGAPLAGAAFLVYGPPTSGSFADADGRLLGETPGAYAGETVALGDVDGDGLADVLVGSWDGTAGEQAGAAYVVFGPAAGERDLGAADILVRGDPGDLAGTGLAAGDVDGDTRPDLLLGASGPNFSDHEGRAGLFFAPAPGTYALADADRLWVGATPGDAAGARVTLADLDGDTLLEPVIGAPGVDAGANAAGAVYVIGGE